MMIPTSPTITTTPSATDTPMIKATENKEHDTEDKP